MNTDERLAQIRELAEKLPPGELVAGLDLPAVANNDHDRRKIWRDSLQVASCVSMWLAPEVSEAYAAFFADARTAIPELLTLLDEQKKRIEELEVSVKALDEYWMPTAKNEERLRLLAEARASRAEQALKEAELKRDKLEETIKALLDLDVFRANEEIGRKWSADKILLVAAESALSTERERVIQRGSAAYYAQEHAIIETSDKIVRRVTEHAVRLAIARHDLLPNENLPDETTEDEIVSDVIAVSLGEDTGCLDPEEINETNCELLFVEAAIRALSSLPTPPQPETK